MATVAQQLDELLGLMTDPLAEDSQNVTGIIYGDNGGGKTITAIRLAKAILDANRKSPDDFVLFIDAVNAWRSLKNHPELQGNVERVPYQGKVQLDTLNMALEAASAGSTNPQIEKFKRIRVVILDEASSMTDQDGDVVLAAGAANDSSKDPDILTQPDMGKTTERMRRTITKLLKQDISVIMVCHQRQDEDKNVGYKVIRPRFMPKFSGTVREGLDFVAHMTAAPEQRDGTVTYVRKLQCNPTKTVVAKTRVGGLGLYATPEVFVPTVVEWMKGNGKDNDTNVVINDVPSDSDVVRGDSDFSDFVVS